MSARIVPANVRRNAIARLNRRVKANLPLAGEAFDWMDETTGKGIGGSPAGFNARYGNARNGLRVLVWDAQGGLCAACGHGVALTDMEVAHIVRNGGCATAARGEACPFRLGKGGRRVFLCDGDHSKSRGYVAGNVYGSHALCNQDDADLFGDVVPPASLARPDVVSLTYWTRADMLAADQTYAARVSAADAEGREARLARRLRWLAEG